MDLHSWTFCTSSTCSTSWGPCSKSPCFPPVPTLGLAATSCWETAPNIRREEIPGVISYVERSHRSCESPSQHASWLQESAPDHPYSHPCIRQNGSTEQLALGGCSSAGLVGMLPWTGSSLAGCWCHWGLPTPHSPAVRSTSPDRTWGYRQVCVYTYIYIYKHIYAHGGRSAKRWEFVHPTCELGIIVFKANVGGVCMSAFKLLTCNYAKNIQV